MLDTALKIYTMRQFLEHVNVGGRHRFGTMVCTSGGYDPIHPGHISCMREAKRHGDYLVVLVNGDDFLFRKKGQAFMDIKTRSHIVAALEGVDAVVQLTDEFDQDTVIEPLRLIRPHVFAKGGDRCDKRTIPEWDVCQANDIRIITGVGKDKEWSSSDFLRDWVAFCLSSKGQTV